MGVLITGELHFLLFKNLHREFGFTIDGTATEHVIQDCSKVGLKFS